MDLTALHAAVRTLVRDGKAPAGRKALSASQRAAFRALKRDLRQAEGDAKQLVSMTGGSTWMSPPPQPETAQ